MPRPPRIEFSGAFYHVTVRGNNKQYIFLDDHDRLKYLELLERYKKHHEFIIYAYTLMNNHVHLLIETLGSPLSKIMQVINFTYTGHFNRKYDKVGHLFQGRYKACLCDRDEYLLALVRYIHLNPIRSKLVNNPDNYRWSSHRAYMGYSNSLVDAERILRMFSDEPSHARKLYHDFIAGPIKSKENENIFEVVDKQILGDERFIEKVEEKVEVLKKPLKRPSLKKIFSSVTEVTGVSREEMVSRNRNKNVMHARHILVGSCRETGYRLVDLAFELGRDLSVISRWARASESKEIQKEVQKVFESLNARLQA
jgi:REP element-mobilizing transposase RayT